MFEAVLCANGSYRQDQFERAVEYSPRWDVDEDHMCVEALEVACYVSGQGMP